MAKLAKTRSKLAVKLSTAEAAKSCSSNDADLPQAPLTRLRQLRSLRTPLNGNRSHLKRKHDGGLANAVTPKTKKQRLGGFPTSGGRRGELTEQIQGSEEDDDVDPNVLEALNGFRSRPVTAALPENILRTSPKPTELQSAGGPNSGAAQTSVEDEEDDQPDSSNTNEAKEANEIIPSIENSATDEVEYHDAPERIPGYDPEESEQAKENEPEHEAEANGEVDFFRQSSQDSRSTRWSKFMSTSKSNRRGKAATSPVMISSSPSAIDDDGSDIFVDGGRGQQDDLDGEDMDNCQDAKDGEGSVDEELGDDKEGKRHNVHRAARTTEKPSFAAKASNVRRAEETCSEFEDEDEDEDEEEEAQEETEHSMDDTDDEFEPRDENRRLPALPPASTPVPPRSSIRQLPTIDIDSRFLKRIQVEMTRRDFVGRREWQADLLNQANHPRSKTPARTKAGARCFKFLYSIKKTIETCPRAPRFADQMRWLKDDAGGNAGIYKGISELDKCFGKLCEQLEPSSRSPHDLGALGKRGKYVHDIYKCIIPMILLVLDDFFCLGCDSILEDFELPDEARFCKPTLALVSIATRWLVDLEKAARDERDQHPKAHPADSRTTNEQGIENSQKRQRNPLRRYLAKFRLALEEAKKELDEELAKPRRIQMIKERESRILEERAQEERETLAQKDRRWDMMCASVNRFKSQEDEKMARWKLMMERFSGLRSSAQVPTYTQQRPSVPASAFGSPAWPKEGLDWTKEDLSYLHKELRRPDRGFREGDLDEWAHNLERPVGEVRLQTELLKMCERKRAVVKGRPVEAWARA